MVKTNTNITIKNYKKTGIIAAIVLVVAALGIWAISGSREVSVNDAISEVSTNAVSGADMRMAVIRMDARIL